MKVKTGKILKCAYCGKEVYVPKNRLNSFKYCSRSCLAKGYLNRGVSICPICGKEFEYISCRTNKAKYCSRSCYYKAQHLKGSIDVVCKNCGKIFKTSPSHKRVFCTKECKRQYMLNFWTDSFSSVKKCLKRRGRMLACEICGYNEYPEILGVHHKDGNHNNNALTNLIVVCPNCHSLAHNKHVVHGGYKNAT